MPWVCEEISQLSSGQLTDIFLTRGSLVLGGDEIVVWLNLTHHRAIELKL